MKRLAAALLTVGTLGTFAGLPATANAAIIDFSSVPTGMLGGADLSLPLATFHTDGLALFDIQKPSGKFLCGLGLDGADCRGGMSVNFTLPFLNVSFMASGYNLGDVVSVDIFRGATLLQTMALAGNGLVDLAGLGTITSLVFNDSSSAQSKGMSFGFFNVDLAFNGDPDEGSDVPLPAALPLLLSGMGAMGGMRILRRN